MTEQADGGHTGGAIAATLPEVDSRPLADRTTVPSPAPERVVARARDSVVGSARGGLRADIAALGALLAIVVGSVAVRFEYDNWISGFDTFTFFVPAFGYIGDRLREGQIPAWNPYFSSGAPMAGDAGGGWMYLPVMLAFALFPLVTAFKVMVLIQSLIGGVATYLFGRRIGFGPLAALFSGAAFAVGPMLYGATGMSTVIGQVSAFLPVALLSVEAALRTPRLSARLGWAALAGVAISQMLMAWPLGCIYGLIVIAFWMGYRLLFAPVPRRMALRADPEPAPALRASAGRSLVTSLPRDDKHVESHADALGSWTVRLRRLLITGVAMGLFAATFSAAGLLPRLEFSEQSTIPGGDYSDVIGGNYAEYSYGWVEIIGLYFQESMYWRITEHSAVVLLLAVLAIVAGRNRFGIPAFLLSALLMMDLAANASWTRDAFSLIPGFETVHDHRPTATVYLVFLPFVMLAGAGVQLVLDGLHRRAVSLARLLPLPIVLLGILAVERAGYPVGWPQTWLAIGAALLIWLPGIRLPEAWHEAGERLPQIAAVALIALMLAYPNTSDIVGTIRDPRNLPDWNDLFGKDPMVQDAIEQVAAREEPGTAAEFLQSRRDALQPFRFAPYWGVQPGGGYTSAPGYRTDPNVIAIMTNARPPRLGLEQISGYNPLRLKHYSEYFEAMNEAPQDYHWLEVFPAALKGLQLFDMLNVRYVVVSLNSPVIPPAAYYWEEVYRDRFVAVYENPTVFDRAWIVHDVRPAMGGQELALLNSRQVDGRVTAFVDGPLPDVAPPAGSGPGDKVVVTETAPERIEFRAEASAPGLLVLSEVYAEGWNAYVDGERVEVLRTNHALRGVPLPAGEHEVVVKYEPRSLRIGLWSTGLASVAMLGIWAWALVDWRRRGGTRVLS